MPRVQCTVQGNKVYNILIFFFQVPELSLPETLKNCVYTAQQKREFWFRFFILSARLGHVVPTPGTMLRVSLARWQAGLFLKWWVC